MTNIICHYFKNIFKFLLSEKLCKTQNRFNHESQVHLAH